ncbi:unnamed protein product [Linum tenue]|uniref:Uncharacterized protein n=1 Tax=Linum tenue TaxID=586396 RepID=A0AAV0Q1D2_9ROSI|nr:unnamed protein product [Linum tenue]
MGEKKAWNYSFELLYGFVGLWRDMVVTILKIALPI